MASTTHTPPSQVVHFDDNSHSALGRGIGPSGRGKAWPSRRHTPYTKTPKSRKLHGKSRLERTPPANLSNDAHSPKQLINKTWHVYQVTPLHNFQHTAAALKKYSRHLSAALQAESHKGIGVDMGSEIGDRAIFSILKGLATSSVDPQAVELTVKAKGQGRGANAKVTCSGILCSVGSVPQDGLDNRLTVLPVLLVKGTVAVTRYVISWLQTQFDCHIQRMTFNPMALVWMVSMWAGTPTEDKSKAVELLYSVPKDIEGLNHITLTIEAKDAKALWDSIHDSESSDFSEEEVAAFIKALEAHFFHHFKIHLSALRLSRIGTTLVYIGSEGRLKILSEKGVHAVLEHITELAVSNYCKIP